MKGLVLYHVFMYRASCHPLIPVLGIVVYCGCLHILSPISVAGCFTFSMIFLFTSVLLDGFFSYRMWQSHLEEILLLKCGSVVKYYLSKEMLFMLLAIVYAAAISVYPSLLISFGVVIVGEASVRKLVVICFLHLLVALCGYEMGSLFQPHMIGKRVSAMALLLFTVLGILARQALSGVPILKYLLWIFPPIAEILRLIRIGGNVLCEEAGRLSLQLILCTLLVLAGKGYILNRRKWAVYE